MCRRMPCARTIPQLGPMIVADQRDGLIPQPGPRFDESPAQVDVLTRPQGLVEPAHLVNAVRRQMIAALGTYDTVP